MSAKVQQRGFTLIELLVSLVILAILAAVAIPYAELGVRRDREIELRRSLRQIRTAIDEFHDDWKAGRILKSSEHGSDDGYPKTLEILVKGVPDSGPLGKTRRYLRSIPKDPFGDGEWKLRSYQDDEGESRWGGEDVYDIHSLSDAEAIDGSRVRDW